MDIRIMQSYLAVIREGNISAAAEALHVSQPALSRQMKDLENELGVTLFKRGKRRITLTEEGFLLRKRAEEMVNLMQLTETELSHIKDHVVGDIRIGAGESQAFHHISRTVGVLGRKYPDIRFLIVSGDTRDLMEQLDSGLLDFALIFSEFDPSQYHSILLPGEERFGVLMRKDSPLAKKKTISLADLKGVPVIMSRASDGQIPVGTVTGKLNVAATYNLIYNASLLVEDGLGYAICFDGLINVSGDSPLCFRLLKEQIHATGSLIWKKYQVFSPAANLFIEELKSGI